MTENVLFPPRSRRAQLRPGVLEANRVAERGNATCQGGVSRGVELWQRGLALVSAVARMHGARLSLDDAAPGLRVTLRFPMAREPDAAAAARAVASA